jgi:hypothetical protein
MLRDAGHTSSLIGHVSALGEIDKNEFVPEWVSDDRQQWRVAHHQLSSRAWGPSLATTDALVEDRPNRRRR